MRLLVRMGIHNAWRRASPMSIFFKVVCIVYHIQSFDQRPVRIYNNRSMLKQIFRNLDFNMISPQDYNNNLCLILPGNFGNLFICVSYGRGSY